MIREIVTPEGIPLRFARAGVGDRLAAFVLDLFLQSALITAVAIAMMAASKHRWEGSWLTAIITIVAFLVMNFYFVVFEVRWQGSTPGKRRAGIRVIDARGGQLETRAVIVRNLMRELELWTPLRLVLAYKVIWPGAPSWAIGMAIAWAFAFMAVPLFNRDRMRVGDYVAGTTVVLQPRVVLVPDLVAAQPRGARAFTAAQLSIYGVFELQVLERVLRAESFDPQDHTLREIAAKVRAKIGFAESVDDDEAFLREFYAAQRAHLEQKLLLGQERADKHAAP